MRRVLPAVLVVVVASAPMCRAASTIETEVRLRYPGILAEWARGEEEQALAGLQALETGVVRPNRSVRDIETLWRAKLGVLRDAISRSSIEVLVPVMVLHHDVYRRYAAERNGLFSAHSQQMSAELAEVYAGGSERTDAPIVAADLLASLAGQAQSGLMMRASADLFDQALELDPGNLAAHMGLGSLFERRGELAEARLHYEKAVELAPRHAEAVLRYAICAARLGETAKARRALDLALSLEGPDWVQQVAFQEQARLAETPEERVSVAEAARRRFPDSSRQAIQLAFLLEQKREAHRSLDILQQMPSASEPTSARYRYAHWPEAALAEVRARLEEAAGARRATLVSSAESVSTSTEEGE